MKRAVFIFALMLIILTFSTCFAVEFNDVSKDHWAYEFINKLSNDNIINGFEDGSFRPSETLTKAQFIKLMVSSDNLLIKKMNELLPNNSIERQWFENYFDVAEEYYLLPNSYNKNDLNTPISRKDMAEILSNFIKFVSVYNSLDNNEQARLKQELDNNPEFINNAFSEYIAEIDTKLSDSFADVLNLDKRTQENIYVVKDLGIINGYEDGTFRPYNFVTRAEASKVISKYIDESSVGIIISNLIFNRTNDIVNDASDQIDSLAIQASNQMFIQFVGKNMSASTAKTLLNYIINNNINTSQKVKIAYINEINMAENERSTKHSATIRNDAIEVFDNNNDVAKKIYESKDSKWNIYEHYNNNGYIDSIEFYQISGKKEENINVNQTIKEYSGIYTNKANETLKYTGWVTFHEGRDNNYFSVFVSDKNSIYQLIPESFWKSNNRYIINFTESTQTQFDIDTINCQFVLVCDSTEYDNYIIDMYNLSADETYLESQLRGEKYNFYKVENKYGISEYIDDTFEYENPINGIYNDGEKQIEIISIKNQNFGANDAIILLSNGSKNYYWKENLREKSIPYVLDLYLKNKNVSTIKDIYTNRYYANYCSGLIIYNDGTMEHFSIQMSKTEAGKVQIDSEHKLTKLSNIIDYSNDMEFLDKWNHQTFLNENSIL